MPVGRVSGLIRSGRSLSLFLDKVCGATGRASALLLPVLMFVIVGNVIARYGFGLGLIELEELQWHLNALIVLGALAYAYQDDAHVRVDIFHSRFTTRRKALVEAFGCLVLLLPFVVGMAWVAYDNFQYSFSINEGSPMPSGLPARYLIKFALFGGFFLLGLQAISQLIKSLTVCLQADASNERANHER